MTTMSNGGGKHHHGHSNHHHVKDIPETVVGELGTAKRNILRKGKPPKYRKDDASGKLNEEIVDPFGEARIEKDDPCYDSEADEDDAIALMADDSGGIASAKLTLTQFKKIIENHVSEFFVSGDYNDLIDNVRMLGCLEYGYELVKRGINMSFDKGDREREMMSKFLCYAHPYLLSTSMIGKGFERLFEIVDEIAKDAPHAKDMLSKFLARAVLDEVLSPSFLNDAIVCNLGGEVVDHSKRMLSQEHAGAKLESCWGPGDGRPVTEMKVAVDQTMQEYILSGDMMEATRCILELQAPHFYHEVVKRAIVTSIDQDHDKMVATSKLLTYLTEQGYLKSTQARLGFNRLYSIMDDLVLDTPAARQIVMDFTKRAIVDGVLPKSYVIPSSSSDMKKSSSEDDVVKHDDVKVKVAVDMSQ